MCLQSAVKGGPDDVENLQPRMDISFWNLVPCYSIHTEPGLCLSTAICAAIGGTPSGSCMHRMSMTKTCCIINSKKKYCAHSSMFKILKYNRNTFWQRFWLPVRLMWWPIILTGNHRCLVSTRARFASWPYIWTRELSARICNLFAKFGQFFQIFLNV